MNTLVIALVCCMVVSVYQQVLPGMNCTSGSFMDTLTNSCQPCTPAPEDYNAVEEYACNSTHDAKYRCKEGFFNSDGAETLVCQKCRKCNDPGFFVVKSCSAEQDTECSSQKIGAGEPTTTTARNRINTTTSPNMTSTQQDKTATDSPTSTSTNSQRRMTFSNKTSPNMRSTTHSTRGTDNTTNGGTGLLCVRNDYVDEKTNSCKLCSYNDLDLHSQQTLVPCPEGKNRTQDNCPKQCFVKEVSFDWFILLYIIGEILLLLCLIVCCVYIYRRCKATREAKLTLPLTLLTTEEAGSLLKQK